MKKEHDPIPEIDESLLTEEQKAEMAKDRAFPLKWVIFTGIVLTLIIVCVIVILNLPSK